MSIKIKVSERNTNKHTPEGMEILENSINKVGVIESISTTEDDVIISGHARHEIFNKRGMRAVEVILNDDEYAVLKTKIKSNTKEYFEAQLLANTTAHKNFNLDMDMVESIVEEFDLIPEEVGVEFLDGEIELEAQEDDFDTTPPKIPFTVLGDLYEIGEHRLLCGDSTDSDQVAKLMNGQKADMVFTDPPYGMNLDTNYADIYENAIAKAKNQDKVIGDDKEFNFLDFYALFEYVKEQFWWGADYYQNQLPSNGSIFVWDKVCESLEGRIGNEFELCWSKQRHKKEIIHIKWAGFLGLQKEDGKRQHPTQKPIRLCESFISRFSKENNLLIDPFLGSGSTMVASHQLKRKCYGMELDCRYADVIVKRMLKLDETLTVKRNGIDCKAEFQ